MRPERGGRAWLAALLILGLLLALAMLWTADTRPFVLPTDTTGYTEQAQSLLQGRGLAVDFVRFFFLRYPDIPHPDDVYPPLQGWLLALSILLLGANPLGYLLPSVLFGCVVVPLAAYLLARQIGARPPFAFAAGMSVMLADRVLKLSRVALSDLTMTGFAGLAVWLALRPGPAAAAGVGFCVAAATYAKPAGLLLIPGLLLTYPLLGRRDGRKPLLSAAVMLVATLLVLSPWLVRNARLYGDPLYTANKDAGLYAMRPGYALDHLYKVRWAESKVTDAPPRRSLGQAVVRRAARWVQHLREAARSLFGLGAYLILPAALLTWRRRYVQAVLLNLAAFIGLLTLLFEVAERYLAPAYPLIAAAIWLGADEAVRRLSRRRELRTGGAPEEAAQPSRALLRSPAFAAVLLCAVATLGTTHNLAARLAHGIDMPQPSDQRYLEEGSRWAKRNLPRGARVMSPDSLRFHHYSGLLSVNVPYDSPERIQAVVSAYRVTHVVAYDRAQRGTKAMEYLRPYLRRYAREWTRLRDTPSLIVYARKAQAGASGSQRVP